jgi:hypothetical protein
MNEDPNQSIGEPQPINPRQGRKILKRVAAAVTITVGGLIAFANLLVPTRVSGASRSARLQWQQRQKEIRETIQHDCAVASEVQKSGNADEVLPKQ